MKIIAFTGMPLSGKTEAVSIAKELGIPVIRMGDAVWEEVKKQGLKLNDANVGTIANQMRNTHGKDVWARRTLDKIGNLTQGKNKCIIIDGIRNVEEIDLFKKELNSDFILIAIDASSETRKKRAMRRKRIDDSNRIKDFEERDKRETRWGIGEVISSADIVIFNEDSIDEFHEKIKRLLYKFLER